jgi:alkaline phosphatase
VDTQQGIRQFVVGTGGAELHPVGEPIEGSEVTENTTFGVLELTLLADEYRWRFLPVPGGSGFTDSGSASCH